MDISFKSKKLAKSFNEGQQLVKIHGKLRVKKIRIRMKALRAAATLKTSGHPKAHLSVVMSSRRENDPASCLLIWTIPIV